MAVCSDNYEKIVEDSTFDRNKEIRRISFNLKIKELFICCNIMLLT